MLPLLGAIAGAAVGGLLLIACVYALERGAVAETPGEEYRRRVRAIRARRNRNS